MNKRFNFKNWFEADKEWKQNFQITNFFPDSESWNYSDFFPKVTFFSVFGDRNRIEKSRTKVKIFWTGEDVTVNHVAYKDNAVNLCNLSIGFVPEEIVNSANYCRYPLWLLYYFGNHKSIKDIQNDIDSFNQNWIKLSGKKQKFCSLVASHDKYGTRRQLYELLNSYNGISCGGKIFHNDDSLVKVFDDDKQKYLEQFVFNLCPENVSAPGYTTEKVFQSFASGCIPIYYGSEGVVEPDVVDNTKIIFYDGNNGNEVIKKVKELYEDKQKYIEFMRTPPIKSSAAKWIYERNCLLENKLKEIL